MMKRIWTLLLFSGFAQAQGTDAMDAAREHSRKHHGDSTNYLLMAERLEQRHDDGDSSLDWEAQGWIGKDINRFWFKTEGEGYADGNDSEESELQLLYGRAIAPFWDLQAGVRHDFDGEEDQTHVVLGLQGLAPYWFETDLAGFVSEDGDISLRLEVEYEVLFTQRLILQPRMEMHYHFDENPELGYGKGLSELDVALRLRYELRREFAPYVGVQWSRSFGGTADLLRMGNLSVEEGSIVAGLRIWY